MFDPLSSALRASSVHSPWALPIVFAAGAVSSIGPCVAPRLIAAVGLTAAKDLRESVKIMGSFICGLVLAYACFGAIASLVGRAVQFSAVIYGVLAAALGCAGTAMLWAGRGDRLCAQHMARRNTGIGASFLIGASFALVVSPCCTPLVVAILAYTTASGDPLYGSSLLAVFAMGHALPLLGVGAGAQKIATMLSRANLQDAASTVAAALMLALAAYYAVLA
jgi:cytochrome c biogenesis protein CcdA